jgi:uridine phosphorylase
LQESELILNPDGSIYHLAVLPEDIAPVIITVGDPERVSMVSKHFDSLDIVKSNREFLIHTGIYDNKPITCLSTGMGTDNIDIVLNELDALVNIDLTTRKIKPKHTALTIARIGSSGSIQKDIEVGTVLVTDVAIGLESLFDWYETPARTEKESLWLTQLNSLNLPVTPSVFQCNTELLDRFSSHFTSGITLTTGGFYAPQNRKLRLNPSFDIIQSASNISVDGQRITNIEMETAGIYGLSTLLGHKAISVNAIMANRITGRFASDPQDIMERTIKQSLDILCAS